MEEPEEIGVIEYWDVVNRSGRLYAKPPTTTLEVYELKAGDRLRVEILNVVRGGEGQERDKK